MPRLGRCAKSQLVCPIPQAGGRSKDERGKKSEVQIPYYDDIET
jgi:hypothetical protein